MQRDIIRINEEKCSGCGSCVSGCPEGALQIIDGKARVINELFCDGLGACIGECPEGAIDVERREAEPYDERKVMKNIVKAGPSVIRAHLQHLHDHGQENLLHEAIDFLKEHNIEIPDYEAELAAGACPGSMTRALHKSSSHTDEPATSASELGNWPIQLQLLNPNAPILKNADLLLAADCVPFACAQFHQRFLKDKVLIILCPKLDATIDDYVDKLSQIFRTQNIASVSVVHMEVPCCSGVGVIVRRALEKAHKDIAIEDFTISVEGEIIRRSKGNLNVTRGVKTRANLFTPT
ncbi:MAG: ATP-binding protein [Halobacteriota archaeon]